MKNFVLRGINSKRNLNKQIINNLSKFSFCVKSDLIENEIMKSFSNISKKFNLTKSEKAVPYSLNQHESVSFEYLKNKYYNCASDKEVDQILKVLFREEVMNIKQEKEYENLITFIKNCKKYNYPEYLTDVKYFKNQQIKNFMTNTSLLESLHHRESPFSLEKEFEMKIKVQNLYNLRKGQKGEKIDSITQKEFEMEKYKYLNYLAETSSFEKLNKAKKINSHNSKVMEEYKKGDNLVDKDEDVGIRDEVWRNHYLEYLKKMKREERKESLGLSKLEEPYFNEAVEKSADRILNETAGSSFNKAKQEESTSQQDREYEFKERLTTTRAGMHFTSEANYINDGAVEPYPYYGKDDYPIEEFFDESKNLPGKDIVFKPLTFEGEYDPIPPQIADWLDRFYVDMDQWSLFTKFVHERLWLTSVNKAIADGVMTLIKTDLFRQKDATIFSAFNTQQPPSLIDYYNLLPKWAREHPSMKMVIRGFEFHQPWASYREKIMMVNATLQILIEKDSHYNELISMAYAAFPEDITQANLPSLLEHNEEEQRNILVHPEDEATDDEEMEIVSTAEEVRAIEREEEEERKLKKKEEGRAKRAAEEAKQASAEGKVDKAAEEKKKKEEAEKKKKAEAAAAVEEEAAEEEEAEVEEVKVEDKELEERIFAPSRRSKNRQAKEEETMNIYDNMFDKLKGDAGQKEKHEEEDEGKEEDDETFGVKEGKGGNKYFDEIEEFRRSNKEQTNILENKKSKINGILNDLKNTENIKTFEEKLKIIRRNLEEVSDRTDTTSYSTTEEPQAETKPTETKTDDLVVYPISLLNSNQLNANQKIVIKKIFAKYINEIPESKQKQSIIALDETKEAKTNREIEEEVMNKIANIETETKDQGEGYDLGLDYKESLKDEDMNIDISEDLGLQDVYYKKRRELDFKLREEDPIPLDYYLNDDGFWDSYIAFHRSKIDIKQFIYKPFGPYKKNIKKKDEL